MNIELHSAKYLIRATIQADGIVEQPDVIGAIFGQTEGLLGNELDLRDLQKSAKIGRIDVELNTQKGKSVGKIYLVSNLDRVETAVLAAALESIERVGPCKAQITVDEIEDVRVAKRKKVIDRAKGLLKKMIEGTKEESGDIVDAVRDSVKVEEMISYGQEKLPAGPAVENSDSIIIVEGRNDVLNLLKAGIRNAIAVEGTNVPKTIVDLSKVKTTIAFVDGDRGGELILRELLDVAEIDYVARAPENMEVEELSSKQIMKSLSNRVPAEQYKELLKGSDKKKLFKIFREERKEEKKETKETKVEKEKEKEEVAAAQPEATKDDLDREVLESLSGTLKAKLFDAGNKEIHEVAVRDLPDFLKKGSKDVEKIIFDGVITQRLVDIASEVSVKKIVGVKMGNVVKRPPNIELITKDMLTVSAP
ncbi:MAG: DNA primase DnaG [Candidatus Thermoplasmatota archaeon]|nr:DNA primase DnaG [Candidatus Thermoplasmatota archaeon]